MTLRSPIDIAIAHGDGIGPEIMNATLSCINAVGAPLKIHEIEVGEKIYLQGEKTGISKDSWDILKSTEAFLKAPITTPQGGGFRSLNVTIRTALGLYANVRPCVAYSPFVKTLHPDMDVVIIRENEEDLYTGIEYSLSDDTAVALKIITETGCQRIIRYAFEYAQHHGRKKVTCFTKDNIMKQTDGMFHRIFDAIRQDYPEIESEHWIVDIGAAKLADTPTQFDVVVLPNLYGDILSDVAAQIAGSVGLAGSANIGIAGAMFEAIHGSAPRRAGQNVANPSGLLLASIMMLSHLHLYSEAELLHNAWLSTIEDGIHTYDIYQEGISAQKVGTREFAEAIIKRLGKKPHHLKSALYTGDTASAFHAIHTKAHALHSTPEKNLSRQTHGSDFFFTSSLIPVQTEKAISHLQEEAAHIGLKLTNVASRGNSIWPSATSLPITGQILRASFTLTEESRNNGLLIEKLAARLHTALTEKGIVDIRGFFLA